MRGRAGAEPTAAADHRLHLGQAGTVRQVAGIRRIQDDQVRLSGKKIDELQAIMKLFREKDYDVPLQFVNMKSD